MENFIEYILRFGNLTQQQIEFISLRGQKCDIKKDEYFAEAGKVFSKVGFVVEGIFRAWYYNSSGEEVTNYFFDEQHLLWNWIDLEEEIVPTQYLQAVTPVRLIVFSKNDWKEIANTSTDWDKIIQKIISKNHAEKLSRRSPLVSQDAADRYNDFLNKYPAMVNRIPLSHIASYLGITQSSLSRIRKNSR